MKGQHLAEAIGEMDDRYYQEAETCCPGRRRRWLRRGAIAACLCAAALGAWLRLAAPPAGGDSFRQLLTALETEAGNSQMGLETDFVVVGDRVALYRLLYPVSDVLFTGEEGKLEELLDRSLGELYQDRGIQVLEGEIGEPCAWYRPAGSATLKYLIKEAADGARSLWTFYCFLVEEELPEGLDQAERETLEAELAQVHEIYEVLFPGTDRSPCPYSQVLSLIYGVEGLEDIASVTISPLAIDNTPLGREIQQEIGTSTYTDPETVAVLYEAVADLLWYGENAEGRPQIPIRFTYSFSTDSEDKLTSGEITRAGRRIVFTLPDGTGTDDNLTYDALRGCFTAVSVGGVLGDPLPEETVEALNRLFGIA